MLSFECIKNEKSVYFLLTSAFHIMFWTSIYLHTASKSNPPLFLAPFGLPCVSPPLKSPIRHPPANLPLTNKKGILTLSAMK